MSEQTQTAVAEADKPKQLAPIKQIEAVLNQSIDRIGLVLPKHLKPERMLRVAMSAIYKTPALLDCDKGSIVAAVIQASELGLEPGGALQHGYLIPYKNKKTQTRECQFQPSYRGLIELARRSGKLKSIAARVVYDKDIFSLVYTGDRPNYKHEPYFGNDPGAVKLVYAVASLEGDALEFEAMTLPQIEEIQKRSQSGNEGPWVTDWAEMAKKTVIKRLLKRLPMSTELASAIEMDNTDYIDVEASTIETKTATRAAELTQRLIAAKQPVVEVEAEANA